MTRRSKIVFLNANEADEVNWRKIVTSGHAQFPVYQGTRDQVIGLVAVKALWANAAIGLPGKMRDLMTPPLFVPRSVTIVQLLESFKQTGKHLGQHHHCGDSAGALRRYRLPPPFDLDAPASDAGYVTGVRLLRLSSSLPNKSHARRRLTLRSLHPVCIH